MSVDTLVGTLGDRMDTRASTLSCTQVTIFEGRSPRHDTQDAASILPNQGVRCS